MKFLSKFLNYTPNFRPLFSKLKPELAKRYGRTKSLHRGQIDRAIEKTKLKKKLIPYAYVVFLRDEDYKTLISNCPEKWKEKEDELDCFLENSPGTLGPGDFKESMEGWH